MKSGTTSLFHYLSSHPAIAPCSRKEPGYFVEGMNADEPVDWYRGLWPQELTGRIALEATPEYAKAPYVAGVPERIAAYRDEHGVDVRLIYLLRDPVERLRSHYEHNQARQEQFAADLGLLEQLALKHLWVSLYARQLDAYRPYFDEEDLHIMTLEGLREDPQAELASVARFLGGDPNHRFEAVEEVHNQAAEARVTPRFLRPLGGTKLAGLVPEPLRDLVKRPARREGVTIELPEPAREFLRYSLERDIRRLETEYRVDTSLWPSAAKPAAEPPVSPGGTA